MSNNYSQNAANMDRPPRAADAIRRARERAQADRPREDFAAFARKMAQPPPSQIPQPQQPQQPSQSQQSQQSQQQGTQRIVIPMSARRQMAESTAIISGPVGSPTASSPPPSRIPKPKAQGAQGSQTGMAISRPTLAPQWPLAGPVANDAEPYRPPPGRSQPPQRPPRPSRVISILDSSRIQDPTPSVFEYSTVNQASNNSAANAAYDAAAARENANTAGGAGVSKMSRESDPSLARQSTASSASRPSTVSSIASIPDFPVPVAIPVAIPVPPPIPALPPPRRSVNLGPPPSARRGASSFYSNASYVSPIPEESPRSRSHGSFASSAAMPETWGSNSSAAASPSYPDTRSYYNDIPEESHHEAAAAANAGRNYDDELSSQSDGVSPNGSVNGDGDESRLVRSASIGKRAKAALVTTPTNARVPDRPDMPNSGTPPLSTGGPFGQGTGYMDASSSSSSTSASGTAASSATKRTAVDTSTMADNSAFDGGRSPVQNNNRLSMMMPSLSFFNINNNNAGAAAASSGDIADERAFSRLSAIRRPPKLDMEAVRKAEARGSMTSLPDLIRRATRLAASLERGRRPASRLDNLDGSPLGFGRNGDRDTMATDNEKYQSGLSDMLAAFPPPAQAGNRRSVRRSLREQVGSWPLPLNLSNIGGNGNRFSNQPAIREAADEDGESNSTAADLKDQMVQRRAADDDRLQDGRRRRRCCGLPLWGFVLVVILVLILVAAAVVIPVEFFVIRKQNNGSATALKQCQAELACANGGTNVVSTQGFCSCLCTDGFTGFDCSVTGDNGCTTTTLTSATSSSGGVANVTVGNALPRLIEQAQKNFSIPLSGTQLLAMFNAGNLSCTAENALVTFDGESERQSDASAEVSNVVVANAAEDANSGVYNGMPVVDGVAIVTETIVPGEHTTIILGPVTTITASKIGNAGVGTLLTDPTIQPFATVSGTTLSISTQITPSIVSPTSTTTVTTTLRSTGLPATATGGGGGSTATTTAGSLSPTASFVVTEEVLDFARVAVLFILQEESLLNAELAQVQLQRFFSSASDGLRKQGAGVTVGAAQNLTLSNGNSINLVSFKVKASSGLAGSGGS